MKRALNRTVSTNTLIASLRPLRVNKFHKQEHCEQFNVNIFHQIEITKHFAISNKIVINAYERIRKYC